MKEEIVDLSFYVGFLDKSMFILRFCDFRDFRKIWEFLLELFNIDIIR